MVRTLTIMILVVLFFVVFVASMAIGSGGVTIKDIFSGDKLWYMIIWQVRFPRVALAFLVGAGLATAGAMYQALLRNPLADPFTLGVSSGAAFGATIGTLLRQTNFLGNFWLPCWAFAGALLSSSIVYFIAGLRRFSIFAIIMAGVILSFFFSSLVMLIFAISNPWEIQTAAKWLMGDLSSASGGLISTIAVFITAGIFISIIFSRELNILSFGEEKATYLGLDVESSRKKLFILSSFITSTCVCVSGIIGFVGLVIPHFVRQITGPGHLFVIPVCVICGASFLALSDLLARTIVAPVCLPVGIITGIVGGLFFIIYFLRTKRWEIF